MLSGQLTTKSGVVYPIKWSLAKSHNETRLNLEIWCFDPSEDPRKLLQKIPPYDSVSELIEEIEFGPQSCRQKMFVIDSWSFGALTVIAQLTQIDQKTLLLFERGLIDF